MSHNYVCIHVTEFSGLLAEALFEFQRRHDLHDPKPAAVVGTLGRKQYPSEKGGVDDDTDEMDDDPLYDKVPSDEDYASVAESEDTGSFYDRPTTTTTSSSIKSGQQSSVSKKAV